MMAAGRALLRWYAEQGVDEAVCASPINRFASNTTADSEKILIGEAEPATRQARTGGTPKQAPVAVIAATAGPSADEAVQAARTAAATCATYDELNAAVAAFDGCGLKQGARNTVFADGAPGARLLIIGEAPGRDEDRIGKPFVGRAGQLLDRMLASIGRSRETDTLISNVVYWRPPGNRAPTQIEIAICRPFVEKLITITQPKAIMLAGGVPTQALLGVTGIMRSRGQWRDIELDSGETFAALPVFHPAFLLRQPAQKRLAWRDLLALKARLRDD